MAGRIEGRTAVVTGGASGLGRAAVLRFLAEGARVLVADRNVASGAETLALAARAGHADRVRFVEVDVAEEVGATAMVAEARRAFGRVDCVINNAGIGGAFGPLMRTAVEDWDYTFAVLVRAVFLGIKHGARAMVEDGVEGAIVNTASVAAFSGGDAPAAYSSAKAAVVNLTRAAAVELAAHRIRVNCICPGAIVTPLFERGKGAGVRPEALQPWPEAGRGEDFAGAALYLAGDDARFVTGATLVVDGGLTAAGSAFDARLRGRPPFEAWPGEAVGVDHGTTGRPTVVRSAE